MIVPREAPRVDERAGLDEALAPVLRALDEMRARIEDLERRPAIAAVPPIPTPRAPAIAPAVALCPRIPAVAEHAPQAEWPHDVVADAHPVSIDLVSLAALDGKRRQRNMIAVFSMLLLALMGGLLGAMALSHV